MPNPRSAPYSKDEPALTYSVIKQLIDAGIQRAIDTISDRFTLMETRVTTVEEKSESVQQNLNKLSQETVLLSKKYSELKTSSEMALRHAFSFEFLLHGIPEANQATSDWPAVQEFLTLHNLHEIIPHLDGVAYRLGRPRERSDRPRPIVVKDSSRRYQQKIIATAGKKCVPSGSPYCSPHFTKLQLDNIRSNANKKNSITEANTPMDN